MKLKFGRGNAKLDKRVATFSLPAGRACPGALECRSMAVLKGGKRKIKDGSNTIFRCFAASQEVLYTKTFEARRFNYDKLKGRTVGGMTLLLDKSLPKTHYIRIHVSGDFFNQNYFDAWLEVAKNNRGVLFYAYTKSLPYWVARLEQIPANLILTASFGGRYDSLITQHDLRYAKVVYSVAEAKKLGLSIDHDDTHAMKNTGSFALLIHGLQPKGSEASKALSKLKKAGKGVYNSKTKKKKVKLPTVGVSP